MTRHERCQASHHNERRSARDGRQAYPCMRKAGHAGGHRSWYGEEWSDPPLSCDAKAQLLACESPSPSPADAGGKG